MCLIAGHKLIVNRIIGIPFSHLSNSINIVVLPVLSVFLWYIAETKEFRTGMIFRWTLLDSHCHRHQGILCKIVFSIRQSDDLNLQLRLERQNVSLWIYRIKKTLFEGLLSLRLLLALRYLFWIGYHFWLCLRYVKLLCIFVNETNFYLFCCI